MFQAVHNYIAIIHHLRPWSPEGHALMRALHNVRYFYNATASAKEQTTTLKEALVNFFHVVSVAVSRVKACCRNCFVVSE